MLQGEVSHRTASHFACGLISKSGAVEKLGPCRWPKTSVDLIGVGTFFACPRAYIASEHRQLEIFLLNSGISQRDTGAYVLAGSVSPQALSILIGAIYDCALDPSHWKRTLADVSVQLNCEVSVLYLMDTRNDRFLKVGQRVDRKAEWALDRKNASHLRLTNAGL